MGASTTTAGTSSAAPRVAAKLSLDGRGVEQLLRLGSARAVPERRLSALVDEAIAEFVVRRLGKDRRD